MMVSGKEKKFWLIYVVNQGRPIPENVHDYENIEFGIGYFFRGSKYNPKHRKIDIFLKIKDSENN